MFRGLGQRVAGLRDSTRWTFDPSMYGIEQVPVEECDHLFFDYEGLMWGNGIRACAGCHAKLEELQNLGFFPTFSA